MKKTLPILFAGLLIAAMSTSAAAQSFRDIPNAVAAPTIDGSIDAAEWANALTISVEDGQNLNWVTTDAESKFGQGSSVLLMWDADYLYVAAAMNDETISATNPEAGGALNSGDGVQLCFYASDSAANGAGSDNLFWDFLPWTGDSHDPATAETYEHFNIADTTPNVKIASTVSDKGYVMEFAIPWSEFAVVADNGYGATYKGEVGTQMIMMVAVMDMDSAGGQSLGYITDAWCDPATTDVYTLSAASAGTAPVVETPADETQTPAEGDTAPVEDTTTAPITADAGIALAGLALAASAAVVLGKKK